VSTSIEGANPLWPTLGAIAMLLPSVGNVLYSRNRPIPAPGSHDRGERAAVRNSILASIVILAGVTGCGLLVDCDTGIAPAVVVEVRDAVTGAPAAADARGIVRDGTYSDSLYLYEFRDDVPLSLAGADERPGTYTVTLEKPGYETWTVSAIRVNDSNCHVQTVFLTAELTTAR
jgi:hypothetical protein